MRYSRQHKGETHNRLLKKAAEEFRRNGVQGKGVRAIVNHYLSAQHRDNPEGCALAGLAGEMARQPEPVRNAYISAMNHRLKRIAALLPGDDEKARFDRARLLMAGMAGTMMIAKAMTDREVSDHFLEQARAFYAAAF